MKYIDAEKLIAEIEGLKEPNQPYLSDFENGCIEGHNNVLDDILSIIASLQQEQPEVDLEREAVMFCFDSGFNITPHQAKEVARHFYELGLNAKKEEIK